MLKYDKQTKILKCLPRISARLDVGQVFDGRATGIHTNESLVARTAQFRAKITQCIICRGAVIGDNAELTSVIVTRDQRVSANG
ncbi:hypothetical protein OSTOST_15211 [Ostertagia ostertagi]